MDDYSHIPAPPPPPGMPAVPLAPLSAAEPSSRARRRRWSIGVGTVAVLALAFGAVVALRSGGDSSSQGVLARAAAATEAEKTARIEMTVSMPVAGTATPITTTAEVDFGRKLVHATTDLSAVAGAATGSSRTLPALGKVEMISTGLVVYMKMPALDALTGGSGKWWKLDYGALLQQSGLDPSALLSQQGNDPAKMLDLLRKVADVTEVGPDTVRGTATTHYRATVDPKTLYADAGAIADDAKVDELLAQFTGPMVFDVWIGSDQLVHKYTITSPTKAGDLSYSYVLYDFGIKVDVAVPADADTVDMTSLLPHK